MLGMFHIHTYVHPTFMNHGDSSSATIKRRPAAVQRPVQRNAPLPPWGGRNNGSNLSGHCSRAVGQLTNCAWLYLVVGGKPKTHIIQWIFSMYTCVYYCHGINKVRFHRVSLSPEEPRAAVYSPPPPLSSPSRITQPLQAVYILLKSERPHTAVVATATVFGALPKHFFCTLPSLICS